LRSSAGVDQVRLLDSSSRWSCGDCAPSRPPPPATFVGV
jgi:hypothetical protein